MRAPWKVDASARMARLVRRTWRSSSSKCGALTRPRCCAINRNTRLARCTAQLWRMREERSLSRASSASCCCARCRTWGWCCSDRGGARAPAASRPDHACSMRLRAVRGAACQDGLLWVRRSSWWPWRVGVAAEATPRGRARADIRHRGRQRRPTCASGGRDPRPVTPSRSAHGPARRAHRSPRWCRRRAPAPRAGRCAGAARPRRPHRCTKPPPRAPAHRAG